MNLNRLKQAEESFLDRYPGGFQNPELMAIRQKKHNVDKMIALVQESFSRQNFQHPDKIVKDMIAVVSGSSVISRFEKPRFRDVVNGFSPAEKNVLADGLVKLLHGNRQHGFEIILRVLQARKLGKWALMTVFQAYYHPQREVFVKPTTVKGIIEYFELRNLQYKPSPSWDFYTAYRSELLEMKSMVADSLSPTNMAFSWFLLLSLHGKFI